MFFPKIVESENAENDRNMITTLAKNIVNKHAKLTMDREERENNIIILTDHKNAPKINKTFPFFNDLCNSTQKLNETLTVKISRVRTKKPDKTRSIKVVFTQIWDKRKFMSKLSKLQSNEDHRQLKILHAMGFEDRMDNKKLLKEAYEKI